MASTAQAALPAVKTILKVDANEVVSQVAFDLRDPLFGQTTVDLPDSQTTRDVYLAGGIKPGSGFLFRMEKFNPLATATVATLTSVDLARWGMTGVGLPDAGYLFGGSTANYSNPFQGATVVLKFTAEATPPVVTSVVLDSHRVKSGCPVVDGIAYLVGGTEADQVVTVQKFLPDVSLTTIANSLTTGNMYRDMAGIGIPASLS